MHHKVLPYFPPHTHPLTLAHDPDAVLADEHLRSVLHEQGFQLINEPDPIALRYRIQQARPFALQKPVVVITSEPLNTLPYDLWQQGYHVDLALHRLFPNLSYPVLKELSPAQRHRLSEAQHSAPLTQSQLSHNDTIEYLLETIFDISPRQTNQSRLISWLNEYHADNELLPPLLATYLVNKLRRNSHFADWPLHEMLASREAYQQFVQGAWTSFLQAQGNRIEKVAVAYRTSPALPFHTDRLLQDLLPRLVRTGTLSPVKVTEPSRVPDWARWAIAGDDNDTLQERFAEGLLRLDHALKSATLDWRDWQSAAREWAQLSIARYDSDLHHKRDQLQHYADLQSSLDSKFYEWVQVNYKQLATRFLPEPHHLYHIPTWLAHKREQKPNLRIALVILDGMSLPAWLQIRGAWQARHANWTFTEKLLLAQVPTITSVSRQALVSGRLPPRFDEFGGSINNGNREDRGWSDFWSQRDLPANAVAYVRLSANLGEDYPPAIDSQRTQALCVITTAIDDMVHDASQGLAAVHSSLRVWLKQDDIIHQRSSWLEGLIEVLLGRGYTVTLTSDHGHVEAIGMGQPQEGVVAETRSKRARIYRDGPTAENVQSQYPNTVLWHNNDVLLPDCWVLIPKGRKAFVQAGKRVVSHGGLTIEEMIVPLITIAKG